MTGQSYNQAGQQYRPIISILIKKTKSVCLSVCLSSYKFRRALTDHAEILDSDRGHIFRKISIGAKITKKAVLFTKKR